MSLQVIVLSNTSGCETIEITLLLRLKHTKKHLAIQKNTTRITLLQWLYLTLAKPMFFYGKYNILFHLLANTFEYKIP